MPSALPAGIRSELLFWRPVRSQYFLIMTPSGSSREEHNHVKEVLDNVLDVSQTVHQETTKTTDLMNQLVQTTESVANSMQEISSATNMTATSIEEQSQMTGTIQNAIEQTGHISEQMVQIAEDSNESIRKNMAAMEDLKQQSAMIKDTNHSVTDAMEKLQEKTKEWRDRWKHHGNLRSDQPSGIERFLKVPVPGRPDAVSPLLPSKSGSWQNRPRALPKRLRRSPMS